MDKVLAKIMDEVAVKNGVPRDQVEDVYKSMFRFIKETLTVIDFDQVETEDDLRKVRVNFNVPRVFKLYTTKGRINYAREAIRKSIAKHGEGPYVNHNAKGAESGELNTDSAGSI